MNALSARPHVLVTGGSSSLGDYVLARLARESVDVTAGYRSATARVAVARDAGATVRLDLDDLPDAQVPEVDVLLHLAGIRFAGPLVELAERSGATHVIAISSASATSQTHPLREQVIESEQLLFRECRAAVTVLRPTMIYGSARDRNIRFVDKLVQAAPCLPTFSGGGLVQPVLVDDLADAIADVTTGRWSPPIGDATPVGGPRAVQIGEVVQVLAELRQTRVLPFRLSVRAMARIASGLRIDRGRLGHAITMLEGDRTVVTPAEVGIPGNSHGLREGLALATTRYPSSR